MKLFIITCFVALSGFALAQTTAPGSGSPSVSPSTTSPSGTAIEPMNQEDSTVKPTTPGSQSEEERMRMEEQEEADDVDTDNASDMSTVPSSSPSPTTVP